MTLAAAYGVTQAVTRPDWSPSGALVTPNTPTLIATAEGSNDYLAFPCTAVDSDDTIHLAYRIGTDHNSTANGSIVYRTKPLGGAWSAAEVVVAPADHPGLVFTMGGMGLLPDGRPIITYVVTTGGRVNYSTVRTAGTWSAGVQMTTDYPSGQITVAGKIATVESTLLCGFYYRPTGSGTRGIAIYEADVDTPTTWTQRGIAVAAGGGNDAEEPNLLVRSDGLGLLFYRSDTDTKIRRCWTPDWTRWSSADIACDGNGNPQAGINPSDSVTLITRAPSTSRPTYSQSIDRGSTFSASANLDTQTLPMMYGSVEWVDGGWVGVYGVEQGTAFTGPCNLYEIAFS